MRVSIIGTGYVGLVSGACLADNGHHIVCVDVDCAKVERIHRGESPIHEEGLDDLLRRHVGRNLRATTDLRDAVLGTELTLVAVGTPLDGERIDLRFVREVTQQIGAVLRDKDAYHVVVVKSTVVPGTTDAVVRPLLEEASGKQAGRDFGVGMNPEFLTEGVAVRDFQYPDRIVLGGIDQRTIARLEELYAAFPKVPWVRTNNKTAEMIKYASNSVLATLISFSNEIAGLCTALGGVDVADVMRGVHMAQYFTTRLPDGRTITAPITSFLEAGCGFGGSCLPKDVAALATQGRDAGASMRLLPAVLEINRAQPRRMLELLGRHFPSLSGIRVTVLGLSFKPDTDDVRESPALPIVRMLLEAGAEVSAYDPVAAETAAQVLPADRVHFAPSLEQAVAGAQAVLLVTRWGEFHALHELVEAMPVPPVIVDGRRGLDKTRFARYEGIGVS
jgi:UDPglucose 6-dehydrogenase